MRKLARLGALVASSTLAVSGLATVTAPSAQAVTFDPAPGDNAATWLSGQLTGGLMHNPNFNGFDDYGLTLDAGFAFQAIGGHSSDITSIRNAMASHVDDYVTPDGGPHSYTGGLGKLATFVGNPTANSFGGQNLITQLEARVASAAPIAGRIEDTGYTPGSQFDDDTANTLGQAYAVHALKAAGSTKTASATTFLLKQQCSTGYFRLGFTKDKTAADQSCSTASDSPDTDATAIAVLELASQSSDSTVSAAIAKAKTWLADQQRCDGSFGGGTSTEGSNANSTGLASWVLGSSVASRQAARWLFRQQVPQTATAPQVPDRGAIAYDAAALATGRSDGITDSTQDQWRRATTQAAPGLAAYSTDPTPAIHLSPVTGFRKAGSRISFAVTGADAGTVVCLGSSRALTTASGAILVATMPAGTGTRQITARDGYGDTASSLVKVLGAKTLTVHKSKAKVKRRKFVTVTVSGLQPGERASIRFRNVVRATGTASSTGKLIRSFRVGTKRGKATIAAYGQFGDIRHGRTTIKVVR